MTTVRLEAEVHGEPADLDTLLGALGPEQEDEIPGATITWHRAAPERARLTIAGQRVPPVRAAVNAVLGWMHTVQDVLDVATPEPLEEH